MGGWLSILFAKGLCWYDLFFCFFFSYSVSPLDEEADEDGDLSDLDLDTDDLQDKMVWNVQRKAINHVGKTCFFILKTNQVKLFRSI